MPDYKDIGKPTGTDVATFSDTVSWNLSRSGSDYTKLKQVSHDYKAVDYLLLQTKRKVYAVIVEAFQTVVLDAVRNNAFIKSVYSNIALVKVILEVFKACTQTIIDLLDSQQLLVQAQLQFTDYIFNYIEDCVRLKEIQGSLTYKDIKYINNILGKTDIISDIPQE